MQEKDSIKEQAFAYNQRNENVALEMNADNNKTDNILKQSNNICMKTSATESKYKK